MLSPISEHKENNQDLHGFSSCQEILAARIHSSGSGLGRWQHYMGSKTVEIFMRKDVALTVVPGLDEERCSVLIGLLLR